MKISILSDKNTWLNIWIKKLKTKLERANYDVNWVHEAKNIKNGELCFILSYYKILTKNELDKNKFNLVVHESDLPKGRGWSPITWQIIENKNELICSLFEAKPDKVDSGMIYLTEKINFKGNELVNEIRRKQGQTTIKLCKNFIFDYPRILKKNKIQSGSPTYYKRRFPKDSELDIKKSIEENFNLLRVVDNKKYPAYFDYLGKRFILKIKEKK